MIIKWLTTEWANFTTWFINGIPAPSVPSWLVSLDAQIASLVNFINSLGAWIPSSLLVTVLTAIVSVFILSIGIRVTRIIASYFTGGGGSVA